MRAGLTKLQASHNVSNALLKVGNATFLGGTGGVAPLGPQGILPGDDAKETPSGIRRPKDFGEHERLSFSFEATLADCCPMLIDFKYATLQQGMGVEVKCQRTNPQAAQPLMSSEWIENLPGYANVTYFCPRGVGQRESTSIGIYTVQSVAASVCHSLKSPVITGDILDAENPIYDPDYSGEQLRLVMKVVDCAYTGSLSDLFARLLLPAAAVQLDVASRSFQQDWIANEPHHDWRGRGVLCKVCGTTSSQ